MKRLCRHEGGFTPFQFDVSDPAILEKAGTMLREMIYQDKNRAGIIIWSIANETSPSEYRDKVLTDLVALTHELDDTRLVGAAFDNMRHDKATSTFHLNDKVAEAVDVAGVNKYPGWYNPFPVEPEQIKWDVAADKPLPSDQSGWLEPQGTGFRQGQAEESVVGGEEIPRDALSLLGKSA